MRDEDWMSLFSSPLTDFDFLIHLRKDVAKGRHASGKGKYKNLTLQEDMDINSIGFDPIEQFLEDLENVLGQNVLLFHDKDGGRVIAGLWNPRSLGRKTWRVRLGYSSVPVAAKEGEDEEGKGVVMVNQSGILAEIAMMGEGLVERLEVVKELAQ